MIRYQLTCEKSHSFDGWFASSVGFENQRDRGLINCAVCGSVRIDRALMTPGLSGQSPQRTALSDTARTPLEKLRHEVEQNSDYVGPRFADEARAMHEGRRQSRAIYGEAGIDEARKLVEDGVPIAPLPFAPRRKLS